MGAKKIDMLGQRCGRLFILKESAERSNHGELRWECLCDCGVKVAVRGTSLRSGETRSCGCIQRTHGKAKTRLYRVWNSLVQRCINHKNHGYHNYGGRGISVCEAWRNSFEAFYRDMGDPPSGRHTIERIDNDKGYEADNCCWALSKDQARNTRRTPFLTHAGQTMCLLDWSEKTQINGSAIRRRINRGWSITDALTLPPLRRYLTVRLAPLPLYPWAW
jgi:hypothetical protein